MAPESYILFIEKSSQGDIEHTLSILNIAGRGCAFYGSSSDSGSVSLWLIYQGKNNPAEIKKQLEEIAPIKKVTVVTISSPMKEFEITELRSVFLKIGWDARDISDADLSMFITAKLQQQETHYIDYDHKKIHHSPVKIKIKPLQDHPDFSPDWLQEKKLRPQDLPDKTFTKDDIKVSEIVEIVETEFISLDDLQKIHKRK
jgi:hypothetical protein